VVAPATSARLRALARRALAAPAFDEVPLAGGGLWRHEVDGVVVWVGPAAAVGLALGRARARGLVLQVDQGNGGARVYRVGASELELVATLIVDESAATRATIDLPPPKRASHVPGALTLVAGGLAITAASCPRWALRAVRAGGGSVAGDPGASLRAPAHPRPAAPTPRHADVGCQHGFTVPCAAAEPVPVERLFAWFREAGVLIAARHGDAFVAAGDGAECRIDGGGSARSGCRAGRQLRRRGRPRDVASVLAAHVGAVQVALADGTFTIADAGDFGALDDRSPAARAALCRPGRRARGRTARVTVKTGAAVRDGRKPGQIWPFCPGFGQSGRAIARLRLARGLLGVWA
jgi:hypothetical protein